jgi:energy-converting hydrogenase A subunit R
MTRIFVSDCEGPIAKNDIAFELAAHFVPGGDRVFDMIRKYDRVHANFPKRRDYTVGSASKLILPFLLAFDADNKAVEEFSAANLVLLKGSKATMSYVPMISEAFIVSTSYEHYVRALCSEIGFSLEKTCSTRINLDEYELTTKEKSRLKSLAWEIGGMPPISIPLNAKVLRDFSSRDQETISRLDRIFWKEIAGMHCKKIFSDVNIVGGAEKANAVLEVAANLSSPLKDVMYVGDDATDAEAMKFVRDGGGLAVSVNGDGVAVRSAELAVLSDDSAPVSVLADVFLRLGRAEATSVATNFDRDALWRSPVEPILLDRLFEIQPEKWPKVKFVSEWNMESVADESEQFRKTVHGEPIAKRG